MTPKTAHRRDYVWSSWQWREKVILNSAVKFFCWSHFWKCLVSQNVTTAERSEGANARNISIGYHPFYVDACILHHNRVFVKLRPKNHAQNVQIKHCVPWPFCHILQLILISCNSLQYMKSAILISVLLLVNPTKIYQGICQSVWKEGTNHLKNHAMQMI